MLPTIPPVTAEGRKAPQDRYENRRNPVEIQQNYTDGKDNIKQSHKRNKLFCYLCDPFDTAEQDQRYEYRNDDTLNQVGGRDCIL